MVSTQAKRLARSALLLCAPALVIITALAAYPLLRTLQSALTDARLSTLDVARWVGLRNFREIIVDPDWWHSVYNTLVFAGASVTLETVLGLVVALVLNSHIRLRGALRAAMLVPWAIPAVVSARMWAWMLNDMYGLLNPSRLPWLADDRLSFIAVIIVDVWKTTPFMALLLLAGLQGIPRSLYEAARVEGVSSVGQFLHITLPLLKPALTVATTFRALDALRIFDLPYVLTSNSRNSAVMSVFAYQQLVDFQDVGYGSAASVLVFCVVALAALSYLAAAGREVVR